MVGVVVDGEAVVSTEEAAEIEVTPTPEIVTAMVHKEGTNPKVPKGATRAPNTQMGLQIQPAGCIIGGGNRVIFVLNPSPARGRITLLQNLQATNETLTSSTELY